MKGTHRFEKHMGIPEMKNIDIESKYSENGRQQISYSELLNNRLDNLPI